MSVFRNISVWVFGKEGDIFADGATQALIAASSVLVMGSMLVSPLIADLATVFSVSETAAGWLIVSFTAAAATTLPLIGALADRIERKVVLSVGLILFGLAGAAVGVVERFDVALGLRALQGVGFACSMPIILTLFGDLYSGPRETTVQAMRVSANSVINTIIPLFAGVLFVYSWRYPFTIYLTALPIAAWVWVTIPEVDVSNDWSVRTYVRKMSVFLSDVPIALLMFSFFFRFVVFYGLITYISVLAVQETGLSVVAVGTLLSVRGAVKTVSSTQAGRLSLSYDPAFLSFLSFLCIAIGTTVLGSFPTTAMLVVGVIIWGLGDGLLSPCQKSLVNRLSKSAYRGGAMSVALTFQNVGKVVGPVAVGILLSRIDPAPAFILLGIVGGGIGTLVLLGVWLLTDS